MNTLHESANGTHNRLNGTAKPVAEPEPSKPLVDGSTGRDAGGKFTAGNRLGRGNPHARKVAVLRTAFLNALTEEKLTKMVARLIEMASHGNINAAKLVLAYTIGQPAPAVDPDRLDLEEWKLIDQSPTRTEAIRAALDGMSPAIAVQIVRVALEAFAPKDELDLVKPTDGTPDQAIDQIKRFFQERQHRIDHK